MESKTELMKQVEVVIRNHEDNDKFDNINHKVVEVNLPEGLKLIPEFEIKHKYKWNRGNVGQYIKTFVSFEFNQEKELEFIRSIIITEEEYQEKNDKYNKIIRIKGL